MNLFVVRDWFVHLRLYFQFLLSPIFLWGFLSAGGSPSFSLLLGYLSFHLFGYAGGTAFNSVYDRDQGPIGGLEFPPPIPRGLLPFSLAWQMVGFLLALAVNLSFATIYILMACLSFAYSHPTIRWKSRPIASLGTVAVGQGILACLAGWVCARGEPASVASLLGILALAASTLLTLGFYPLTGIYQIKEDRSRGDKTIPVWLGISASFRFSLICLLIGGSAAIAVVLMQFQMSEAVVLGFFLLIIVLLIARWGMNFDERDIHGNFRTVMRLYAAMSLGFLAWIGWHLVAVR